MAHARGEPSTVDPRLRTWWLRVIAGMDVIYGATYALGGTANTPSLQLMAQALPVPVFGAVLAVAGGLLLTRHRLWAAALAAGVWLVYALASIATVLLGTALSAGGFVLLFGVATLHVLITIGAVSGPPTRR